MLAAAIIALSLAACVESQAPLITDAKPLLGQHFIVHLYEDFADNKAGSVHSSVYQWRDGQYIRAYGLARDAKRFVVEPLSDNDFVIQSTDAQNRHYLYWIGRRLTPGIYSIVGIEQLDADDATRKAICGDGADSICEVTTRDQLLTLARATAAKPLRNPAIGVVLNTAVAF
jgi:hypothetical protein